jgi:hypothetical protein
MCLLLKRLVVTCFKLVVVTSMSYCTRVLHSDAACADTLVSTTKTHNNNTVNNSIWSPLWVTESSHRIWQELQYKAAAAAAVVKPESLVQRTLVDPKGVSLQLERDSPKADVARDVVCLHVRRGDKLALKSQYPHLAEETSAENILRTLLQNVPAGSVLYIATNEPSAERFFAPLKASYSVHTLDSFQHIINEWGYLPSSLALVDYALLGLCTKLVPPRGFADKSFTLSKSIK